MTKTTTLAALALLGSHALLAGACSRQTAEHAAPAAPATAAAATQPSTPAEHCAHAEPLAAGEPLPGMSLYHLQAALTDQHGASLELAAFRGRPVLVTMFYSSCTSICPLLIGQLQRIEAALDPALRAQTRVLLISLDPGRDTSERLAELAKRHGVDQQRWSFTRTSETSVRELAALLGIRYRPMPDGEISHSPVISLLDRDGVLVTRAEGTAVNAGEIAAAIARLLDSPGGA